MMTNHLWQSTLIVGLAGLLSLMLRRNRARVRFWLWFAASMKFVVPFAALTAVGRSSGLNSAEAGPPSPLATMIDIVNEPLTSGLMAPAVEAIAAPSRIVAIVLGAIWMAGCVVILATWYRRWRRIARIVRDSPVLESGRELPMLRRVEAVAGIRRPLAIVSSDASIEPGVFGIWRPVLLWPRTIGERLDDRQVEAILAHEAAHVRRHDNLTAALHQIVEAVFWFHPLVWWLGARLIDERERACDADVVRWGSDPHVYAESLVQICKFYVESPLTCVAGVTGAGLTKRIERIVCNDAGEALKVWKSIVVAAAAVMVIAGPVVFGLMSAPVRAQSPSFEISSTPFATMTIRRNTTDGNRSYPITLEADGTFAVRNMPLRQLIVNFYQGFRISGEPEWLWRQTERFDIEARADGKFERPQLRAMVRRLLADRFQLAVRLETLQVPVYDLVLASADGTRGPRLRPSSPDCIAAAKALRSGMSPAVRAGLSGRTSPPEPSELPCGTWAARPQGTMTGRAVTIGELSSSAFGLVGREVRDRTGLSGQYDVDLEYPPATPPGPPPSPPPAYGRPAPSVGPAFFAAVQEQLGLRFDDQVGPVDFLVIDHVERPVED